MIDREQGVSKAGNPRLRTTMVELVWLWLRYQPGSALSCWFKERITQNGGRFKKTMIVALARKLLVALWKYAIAGSRRRYRVRRPPDRSGVHGNAQALGRQHSGSG